MITIKEIAKEAGVSIGTVDRVLHNRGRVKEETKTKIQEALERLDYRPNMAAQALAVRKKKLKITFFIPDFRRNPVFQEIYEPAVKKAEELKEFGIEVYFHKIIWMGGSKFGLEQNIIHDPLDCDGLVTMGSSYLQLNQYYEQVSQQGKPIVYYNENSNAQEYLAYVGCNYTQSGRLAAGLCELAGGKDAKVCILSQGIDQKLHSYEKRVKGFYEEIEEHYPEMKIVDIREVSFLEKENRVIIQDVLRNHPEVNMIYLINPGDYSICKEIHKLDYDHHIKIVTNDMAAKQVKMMQQGIISATVCQEAYRQGRDALDIMFRYLAFDKKPEEKDCYTNLSIHIAQNSY